jgi:hypothetical protein
MMWNLLVILIVVIFIHDSWGCKNTGNGTHIRLENCDGASYGNLSRHYNLSKILKFDAGYRNNRFPKIDNTMFRGMTNLSELTLHDCKIESIDGNAFSNLKALKILRLRNNKIGGLPENLFSQLVDLEELHLSMNSIEKLPDKLFVGNRKLKTLEMWENRIRELPTGLFDSLIDLKTLMVNDNKLESIHRDTFKRNGKLEKLRLDGNQIDGIAEGTLDALKIVTNLVLRRNSCVDKEYGEWSDPKGSVNLKQVSEDLENCYYNYKFIHRLVLIIAPISSVILILVGGVIAVWKYKKHVKIGEP